MSRNIVFHAGLSKTGTSTIQNYLRSNEDALREYGFLYPGLREHELIQSDNHPFMLNAMAGKTIAPWSNTDVRMCRKAVRSTFRKFLKTDLNSLIWSYEGIAANSSAWDVKYTAQLLEGMEVKIVCLVRFIDEWIESSYKQKIWSYGKMAPDLFAARPLPPVEPMPSPETRPRKRIKGIKLKEGGYILRSLQHIGNVLPESELIIRSYDTFRQDDSVVSGTLKVMGIPTEQAFPGADSEAGTRNPTKSDLYSMLIYHLLMASADVELIRDLTSSADRRAREGASYAPLSGRRFRFLSEDGVNSARMFYEELRSEYPQLPVQDESVSLEVQRYLPKEQAVELLSWLRPDLPDASYEKACALYPPI